MVYTAVLLLLITPFLSARAQEPALVVEDAVRQTRQDIYGQDVQVIAGQLVNTSADAYTNITLMAEVYDADDELVGEGIGYLVNACGAGLLPDFALQPGAAHRFEAPLELYARDAVVDRVNIVPVGIPAEPAQQTGQAIPGIIRLSNEEIARVEWIDARALRYGVGCIRDLFTELAWHHHSLRTDATLPVVHPNARLITPELLAALGLSDPALVENSAIQFAPGGGRLFYQGEANRAATAEPDGRFVRTIYDELFNRTLQGVNWLPEGRFLAYYYGAYGDPVVYFTADEEGRPISLRPTLNLPSAIVPGASPDGRRAVVAGTFFERSGYYLKTITNNNDPQLLFEAEPAGNNYPAPIFVVQPSDDPAAAQQQWVYIARPVDGEARMQCYNLSERQLYDLSALPLRLATDERAQWQLSPDGATVALAANGANGGLWLVDLTALPGCRAESER